MLIVFHKRKRANFPRQYTYIAGAGNTICLKFQQPQEVEDEIAYKILGRDGDIVKEAEAAKPAKTKEKVSRVRKPKKTKVVEDLTTA
jgi:hypothetical protein